MFRSWRSLLALTVVFLTSVGVSAQEPRGQGMKPLIQGNERFGRRMLQALHQKAPTENIVLSPFPLTIAMAAFGADRSANTTASDEINSAFGWGEFRYLDLSARMLLTSFEEWKSHRSTISNSVIDQTPSAFSEEFREQASRYFGMEFKPAASKHPTAMDIQRSRKNAGSIPAFSSKNDVLINSGMHLRAVWYGNTFLLTKPMPLPFYTSPGQSKQVQTLTSEMNVYDYAKTDAFEAVALPCYNEYMIALLPSPGEDLAALEKRLADSPDELDKVLSRRVGQVIMPEFQIRSEHKLRSEIEQIGIHRVFQDLGQIVKVPQSHLTEINQKVDISVTKDGIVANAESVIALKIGGVLSARDAFHMELNRPFLFLVRDRFTDALLFIGAVTDPVTPLTVSGS